MIALALLALLHEPSALIVLGIVDAFLCALARGDDEPWPW